MNKTLITLWIMSLTSGLLLALSFLPSDFFFLSFFGIVPMLEIFRKGAKNKMSYWKVFALFYFSFIVWQGIAASWILELSPKLSFIGLLTLFPMPLLLAFVPTIYRRLGKIFAMAFFISTWLAVEFLQEYFLLSTPFFTLGNYLGKTPILMQWYSYTGVLGGSLWILLINVSLFNLLSSIKNKGLKMRNALLFFFSILFIPASISILIFYNYQEKGVDTPVAVLHTAVDCYHEKYQSQPDALMESYLNVALPGVDANTRYLVFPETAITNGGWLHQFENNKIINQFVERSPNYPQLQLVTGAVVYEQMNDENLFSDSPKASYLKYNEEYDVWYSLYNAALQVGAATPVQFRTKQGLVPFQEKAIFPGLFKNQLAVGIDFRFNSRQQNDDVFYSDERKVTAIICYETVFSHLFTQYAKSGAQAFFIILNEGWYQNIRAASQFQYIAAVRAVENRRCIARSSNMGVSGFINQKGEVLQQYSEFKPKVLKGVLLFNDVQTFYNSTGNYLGFLSTSTCLLIFMLFLVRKFKTNQQ